MGKLLIAAALVIGGYLVHTGHIQIGGSGMRKTTGAMTGYASSPTAVGSGVVGAASQIAN